MKNLSLQILSKMCVLNGSSLLTPSFRVVLHISVLYDAYATR